MRMRLGRWRAALLPGRVLPTPALLLLTGLAVLAIPTLTWRLLEGQSDFIQFLTLVAEIVLGSIPFFIPMDTPRGRAFWEGLQANGRWQVGLGVLAVGLWAMYFVLPQTRSQPPKQPEIGHAISVEGICVGTGPFASVEDAKTHLREQAKQFAKDQLGEGQAVRPSGVPTFENGQNQSEICIKAQFYADSPPLQPATQK